MPRLPPPRAKLWLVGANFESSRLELDDSIGCEIEASRQKFSHTIPEEGA